MSRSFTYKPLEPWQIRLLVLYPGQYADPLAGHLVHAAQLHNNDGVVVEGSFQQHDYQALSYAWQSTALIHPILLNGRPSKITISLAEALQYIRSVDSVVNVWVDALCINQEDNEEKSVQVRKMLDIYSGADMVIVWLGHEGEHTSAVLRYLPPESPYYRAEPEDKAAILNYLDVNLSISERDSLCLGLLDLCTRPWIRRVWVQQEIFAAERFQIRCGSAVFNADFWDFATALENLVSNSAIVISHDYSQNKALLKQTTNATPRHRALLAHQRLDPSVGECCCEEAAELGLHISTRADCILAMAKGLEATKLQDHVYAVLGLTDLVTDDHNRDDIGDGIPKLKINYDRSPSQVFQDLTKHLLTKDESLRILVNHRPAPSDAALALPSWCPDWRSFNHPAHEHEQVRGFALVGDDQDGVITFEGTVIAIRTAHGSALRPTHMRGGKRDAREIVHFDSRPRWTHRSLVGHQDLRGLPNYNTPAWRLTCSAELITDPSFGAFEATCSLCIDSSAMDMGDLAVLPRDDNRNAFSWQRAMPVLRPRQPGGYTFVCMAMIGYSSPEESRLFAANDRAFWRKLVEERGYETFTVY